MTGTCTKCDGEHRALSREGRICAACLVEKIRGRYSRPTGSLRQSRGLREDVTEEVEVHA